MPGIIFQSSKLSCVLPNKNPTAHGNGFSLWVLGVTASGFLSLLYVAGSSPSQRLTTPHSTSIAIASAKSSSLGWYT